MPVHPLVRGSHGRSGASERRLAGTPDTKSQRDVRHHDRVRPDDGSSRRSSPPVHRARGARRRSVPIAIGAHDVFSVTQISGSEWKWAESVIVTYSAHAGQLADADRLDAVDDVAVAEDLPAPAPQVAGEVEGGADPELHVLPPSIGPAVRKRSTPSPIRHWGRCGSGDGSAGRPSPRPPARGGGRWRRRARGSCASSTASNRMPAEQPRPPRPVEHADEVHVGVAHRARSRLTSVTADPRTDPSAISSAIRPWAAGVRCSPSRVPSPSPMSSTTLAASMSGRRGRRSCRRPRG